MIEKQEVQKQEVGSSKQEVATSRRCQRLTLLSLPFLLPISYFLLPAFFLLPVLSGCHSTPPPTPLDQLNAQQQSGHQVFQQHCGTCHYDRTSDSLHGPPLRGIFKRQYLPSGAPANDERVTATVLHGRGLMPAQPNLDPRINPQDLNDLIAYLHTL